MPKVRRYKKSQPEIKFGKQFEAYITKVVESLKPLLGLHLWRVTPHYVERIEADRDEQIELYVRDGYLAEVHIDIPYMTMHITLGRRVFKKYMASDYRGIVEDVCHEMVHAITDEFYEFTRPQMRVTQASKHTGLNERIVQHIAVIVTKQLPEIKP